MYDYLIHLFHISSLNIINHMNLPGDLLKPFETSNINIE